MLTHLHRQVDQGVAILRPLAVPPFDSCEAPPLGVIARVCMFGMPRWFLDPSVSFVQPFAYAVSTSYPALGMSMYMLDLSAWFPQPFGLSGCPLAALSRGVSVSFAILCMPVCTSDMSERFPQLFGSSECHFALRRWIVDVQQAVFCLNEVRYTAMDEDKILVLTQGLPPSYDPFIISLNAAIAASGSKDDPSISLEIVKSHLLIEESHQQAAQPVTTPGVALAVTPATQKMCCPLEQITCFHCGEKGHYQINCLKQKAEEKKGTATIVFEEKEEVW
ncbi:hypothetical protein SCLCIDRAFT_26123 [Scleroderma citrinum Foug A]|uniref:CCHC-type domain-containing protein n=1 Tax=Scleroderma citrinum Foug A TaxID=1036808 RepID=A0A0C3DY97_9AGAM|nr:hypothetical protein SCLCIDRAFT_26123 [Scleroderma citrinum Foug A]